MAKSEEQQQPDASRAARDAVRETDTSEDAARFTVDRLVRDAGGLLEVEPHVAAGALSASPKKKLTLEEAQAAVKAWLKSPVKEA